VLQERAVPVTTLLLPYFFAGEKRNKMQLNSRVCCAKNISLLRPYAGVCWVNKRCCGGDVAERSTGLVDSSFTLVILSTDVTPFKSVALPLLLLLLLLGA